MIAGESRYSSLFHVLRIDQLGDWAGSISSSGSISS